MLGIMIIMTLEFLRKKHSKFVYRDYSWQLSGNVLEINFEFEIEPDIKFRPEVTISPITQEQVNNVPRAILDHWIFNLGMIELFSYWKATASQEIEVQAGHLSPTQLKWWKKLLIKGMGEYFYTNKINFTRTNFVRFVCDNQEEAALPNFSFNHKEKHLVPIGGGKDSALVVKLLDQAKIDYDVLLSYPQSPAADKIAGEGKKQVIEIKRTFDPKLFELNKSGYLNGHTPFSARLAFESSLVALLAGYDEVLLANEFSANEGNVPYLGKMINHQYSKTFEFENDFRSYVKKYMGAAPEYLSLLRPLTELQIAALFIQNDKFHTEFRSCNRGQQKNIWCCDCPKCLFVFTILYPFVEEKELIGKIFPENLFMKPSLGHVARELMGLEADKPFECVGTHEETQVAFYLSIQKWKKKHPGEKLPVILNKVDKEILKDVPNLKKTAKTLLCFWNKEHNLDKKLEKIIQSAAMKVCEKKDQYV